ncbi:hypothetical protein GCM10008966_28100 [Rhodovulum strictum]
MGMTPALVPAFGQVKRECDKGRKVRSAAAPATVTGEVAPPPLADRLGRQGNRQGHEPLKSASRETCQPKTTLNRTGCSGVGSGCGFTRHLPLSPDRRGQT